MFRIGESGVEAAEDVGPREPHGKGLANLDDDDRIVFVGLLADLVPEVREEVSSFVEWEELKMQVVEEDWFLSV